MTDEIKFTVLKINHHTAAHVAQRWPYAAYGSNLLFSQIAERCPRNDLITSGRILDYRLDFARVATITSDNDSTVPVGIYKLSQSDIETLDRREGLGRVYDRYLITPITDDGRAIRCFTYIKRDGGLQPPTDDYFAKLLHGYRDWHFDDRRLRHARARAIKAWEADAPRREAEAKRAEQFRRWVPETPWGQAVARQCRPPRRDKRPDAGQETLNFATTTSLVTGRELRVPRFATAPTMSVEWGERENTLFWRVKGERTWYRDVSTQDDLGSGLVRGEFEESLPGARAFRVIDGNTKGIRHD